MYPIYIPSKGRAEITGTACLLEKTKIEEFFFVVEPDERAAYASRWGNERVLTLPREYQVQYDPLDGHGEDFALGSGPSRNFAWDHAIEHGAEWQWTLDDNITGIYRHLREGMEVVHNGQRFFEDLERYITQYRNVGMGGPQADGFVAHGHQNSRRAVKNTRIYSFILIRTKLPFRWRGRYNEDTILSLDLLTNRVATLLCYQFLMKKAQSRTVQGGNTDELYAQGTGPKSRLLARAFPRYVDVKYRFGRIHHMINYKKHFSAIPLILEKEKRKP